jgi:hypothetical protein
MQYTYDLAVIIVSWNTRALTLQTLDSLTADLATSGLDARVIVVDNASTDESPAAIRAAFPNVHLIVSAENLGFGRGNNLGMAEAGAFEAEGGPRAVYLLNSDTITQPGATRALYDALLSDARVGLVGARLTYGDGGFQHAAFGFPGLRQLWVELFPTPGRLIEGRFNGRYPRALYDAGAPFAIDFPLGATMMLRREVVMATGGFDEAFFMYCEEVDWAWRIRRAGWEARCVPAAHVVHLGGQSTGQVRPQSVVNLWTSRLQLFARYYPRPKYALARRMIALGMARKAARERDAEVRAAYQRVAALGA